MTSWPAVLAHDPFAGDFGDQGDRTLSDKIVTARKGGICHDCAEEIEPGTRIRARTDVVDGAIMRFRWCEACCTAMAVYGETPELLEARISSGHARRARRAETGTPPHRSQDHA